MGRQIRILLYAVVVGFVAYWLIFHFLVKSLHVRQHAAQALNLIIHPQNA